MRRLSHNVKAKTRCQRPRVAARHARRSRARRARRRRARRGRCAAGSGSPPPHGRRLGVHTSGASGREGDGRGAGKWRREGDGRKEWGPPSWGATGRGVAPGAGVATPTGHRRRRPRSIAQDGRRRAGGVWYPRRGPFGRREEEGGGAARQQPCHPPIRAPVAATLPPRPAAEGGRSRSPPPTTSSARPPRGVGRRQRRGGGASSTSATPRSSAQLAAAAVPSTRHAAAYASRPTAAACPALRRLPSKWSGQLRTTPQLSGDVGVHVKSLDRSTVSVTLAS